MIKKKFFIVLLVSVFILAPVMPAKSMTGSQKYAKGVAILTIGVVILTAGALTCLSGGMALGLVPGLSMALSAGQGIAVIGSVIAAFGGAMALTGYVEEKIPSGSEKFNSNEKEVANASTGETSPSIQNRPNNQVAARSKGNLNLIVRW